MEGGFVILDEFGFVVNGQFLLEVIERRDAGVYTALAKFGFVKWISRAYGCKSFCNSLNWMRFSSSRLSAGVRAMSLNLSQ